ncbi:MAG TPA: hypothetical protein VMP68_05645 [Candidatus Eisenbacteria bacterium]|nr:hypothetical protein [Candidatus Eisenbacteria bacterium]
MRNLRKYLMLAVGAVFSAALAVSPALAQEHMTVDVPFNFVLGKATLQSGHYRIERPGASFASFVDSERKANFVILLPGGDVRSLNGQPYLVFTRYGQKTFLNKVVFSSNEVYDLPVSSKEKELRAQVGSGEELAVLIQPVL